MAENQEVGSKEIQTRNILDKFKGDGTPSLSDDEVDFLIERIATGSGKYVPATFIRNYRDKLMQVISKRLNGKSICNDVFSGIELVQYASTNLVPQSEMVTDRGPSYKGKVNDYGLVDVLKENDKLNKKIDENNKWVDLQIAVEKAIVEGGVSEENKVKLLADLKQLRTQENVGRSKIKKIDKMVKKLDPEYYFGDEYTRVRHGIPEGVYKLLSDAQQKERKQKSRALKVKKLQTSLDVSEGLWEDDAKDPWTWGNIGHKLKNKMNKLYLTVTLRSPERLAKRIAKREDISSLDDRIKSLDAKIKEQQKRIDSGLLTPRQEKDVRAQINVWGNMRSSYDANKKKKEGSLKEKLKSLQSDKKDKKVSKDVERIRTVLEKRAKILQTLANERLKEDLYWQVIESLDISPEQKNTLKGANERVEEFFTAPKILEAILKERDYPEDKRQEILATFFPAEKVDDKPQQEKDNTEHGEEPHEDGKAVKTEATIIVGKYDENNAKDLSGCSGVKYSVSDNNWAFKKEGADSLTEDEVKALLTEMKTQGVTSLNIGEGVPVEMYEAIVKAAEENGIEIKNKEDVDQKIEEHKKKESPVKGEVEEPVIEEQVVKPEDNTNPGPATGRDEEAGGKGGDVENNSFEGLKSKISSMEVNEQSSMMKEIIENIESGKQNYTFKELKDMGYFSDEEVILLADTSAANQLGAEVKTKADYEEYMEIKGAVQDSKELRLTKVKQVADKFGDGEIINEDPDYQNLTDEEKRVVGTFCGLRKAIEKKGRENGLSEAVIKIAQKSGDKIVLMNETKSMRGLTQEQVYKRAVENESYKGLADKVIKIKTQTR